MGAARCDRMRLSTPDTGSRQRVNNGDCSILDAIIVNLSCATVRELERLRAVPLNILVKQPRHTSVVQVGVFQKLSGVNMGFRSTRKRYDQHDHRNVDLPGLAEILVFL